MAAFYRNALRQARTRCIFETNALQMMKNGVSEFMRPLEIKDLLRHERNKALLQCRLANGCAIAFVSDALRVTGQHATRCGVWLTCGSLWLRPQ
jgi:hypothetical protein